MAAACGEGSASSAAASAGPAAHATGPEKEGQKDLSQQILDLLAQESTAVDSGKQRVDDIVQKRQKLQDERKKLTAQLRNENRKRQRIRKRSQYLSNDDLVEVLAMRKGKTAKATAKADPKKAQVNGT